MVAGYGIGDADREDLQIGDAVVTHVSSLILSIWDQFLRQMPAQPLTFVEGLRWLLQHLALCGPSYWMIISHWQSDGGYIRLVFSWSCFTVLSVGHPLGLTFVAWMLFITSACMTCSSYPERGGSQNGLHLHSSD